MNSISDLRLLSIYCVLIAVSAVQVKTAEMPSVSTAQPRDWTPTDSVGVRYYLADQATIAFTNSRKTSTEINYSSDGAFFFFTTFRGDLDTNTNQMELLVYSADAIDDALRRHSEQPPSPVCKVAMAAERVPIRNARWDMVANEIYFTGVNGRSAVKQIYRLSVPSGNLLQITNAPAAPGVQEDLVERSADKIIYTASVPARNVPSRSERSRDDSQIRLVTGRELRSVLDTVDDIGNERKEYRTYVTDFRRHDWELGSEWIPYFFDGAWAWFSPDNKYAVLVRGKPGSGSGGRSLQQYYLIDFDARTEVPLFDAPTGIGTEAGGKMVNPGQMTVPYQAIWLADGRHVVIVNTTVPQSSRMPPPSSGQMAYVVSYDIQSGAWDILEPLEDKTGVGIKAIYKAAGGMGVVIARGQSSPDATTVQWLFSNGSWHRQSLPNNELQKNETPVSRMPAHLFNVRVVEGMNEPPEVVVSESGQTKMVLVGRDAGFANIALTETVEIHWRDSKGFEHSSGLLLPNRQGKKIPLVIQIGAYQPDLFRPDGAGLSALSSQGLAARGIAVLNLDSLANGGVTFGNVPTITASPEQLQTIQDWVHSVLQAVIRKYPIDSDRVGLVGHSRNGYYVNYLVAHANGDRFAAGVVADSITSSYFAMLKAYAENKNPASNRLFGGGFYAKKNLWLEHETTFNADHVRAAMLFVDYNSVSVVNNLDTIGALRANKRAFEYLYIPEELHELASPKARLASMTATIDWMCFWLKGEIPSDPERAARWAILRKQQDEVLKTPPPPKGKWVFQPDPVQPEWHPPTSTSESAAGSETSSKPEAPKEKPEPTKSETTAPKKQPEPATPKG